MANSYEVLTTHTVDLRSVDLSGCGEWTKTCEEECVDGGGPIPNLVHFIKTDSDFHFYEWFYIEGLWLTHHTQQCDSN